MLCFSKRVAETDEFWSGSAWWGKERNIKECSAAQRVISKRPSAAAATCSRGRASCWVAFLHTKMVCVFPLSEG
jgi:hypothetical protein